ncbi:MAG: ComF family protein, partial [Desulfovibrio sp.]|nr:ComF family protein [Desulfovibrio sp.]
VDDIITTGSTLRAAGAELLRAGAARVDVLALARTPRP